MNQQQQITLPPIKHVFKGLLNTKPQDPLLYQKNHHRRSSAGMESAVEAARSLQQLSTASAGALPCYHCSPTPPLPLPSSSSSSHACCTASQQHQHHSFDTRSLQTSFGGHRRTVSASIEEPYHRHQHVSYMPLAPAAASASGAISPYSKYQHSYFTPYPHQQYKYQQQQQQQQVQQHQVQYFPRRARAHTTSGYPPTMLIQPHHPMHASPQTSSKVVASESTSSTSNEMRTPFSPPSSSSAKNSPVVTNHRYHCQHCRKSFSRPSSLRIHIYSHTGEKPFKCHYQGCGRSFSVHSNMRRHLRVHYYPQQAQQQQQQQQQAQQHANSMRLPLVPNVCYSDDEEEDMADQRQLMLMRPQISDYKQQQQQQTMCYSKV